MLDTQTRHDLFRLMGRAEAYHEMAMNHLQASQKATMMGDPKISAVFGALHEASEARVHAMLRQADRKIAEHSICRPTN